MNGYPPLLPHLSSPQRRPASHSPVAAKEQRRRTDAVILPPEARIAQRIFQLRPEGVPRLVDTKPPSAAKVTPQPNPIAQALARVVRTLFRIG